MDIEEFFHDFRQDLLSGAEAKEDFLETEFALKVSEELDGSGVIEGFEPCHYKAQRGMRVDGYWINEDKITIDLFISDFINRESLGSLIRTEVEALFRRAENFFIASAEKGLYLDLEETSHGYGLAKDVFTHRNSFSKVNFYLLSERRLSERIQSISDKQHGNSTFTYHIWDISRLYRMYTSKGAKEELIINFEEMFGRGIRCLPAYIDSADYESYLLVMPGEILGELYGRYGGRLLEQNVRCFLQARGKVNKGIRMTIMNNPEMFFAYNNGVTATVKEVVTESREDGIYIKEMRDLQIVNGGQTTASIFHTNRKDKASLKNIFVQMKLSVVDTEKGEEIIPRISEYANTQNRVSAADFFLQSPVSYPNAGIFQKALGHLRNRQNSGRPNGSMNELGVNTPMSRRNCQRAERRKFQTQHPRSQMFTKTDLAKFENVWDEKPTYVNLGAQKKLCSVCETDWPDVG